MVRLLENSKLAPNAREESLLLRIQPYNFTIGHQKCLLNPSNYLSRDPIENNKSNIDKIEGYVNLRVKSALAEALTLKEVQDTTSQDKTFQIIIEALSNENDKVWTLPELLPYGKLGDE